MSWRSGQLHVGRSCGAVWQLHVAPIAALSAAIYRLRLRRSRHRHWGRYCSVFFASYTWIVGVALFTITYWPPARRLSQMTVVCCRRPCSHMDTGCFPRHSAHKETVRFSQFDIGCYCCALHRCSLAPRAAYSVRWLLGGYSRRQLQVGMGRYCGALGTWSWADTAALWTNAYELLWRCS